MRAEPFAIDPESRGRALSILGHFITVLASGEDTASYEIFLIEGPPGTGPAAHRHPWDEALYVTRGAVEITFDEKTQLALPGTLVHLPAGSPHRFCFGQDGGEMLCITSRLGASRLFVEIDQEIAPDRPDRDLLVAISRRNGLSAAD